MILVTTGTNGAPFDRLLQEVDRIGDEPLVVQHGPSALRLAHATCFDYVPFPDLVALVRDARVVVTHGGVGSILISLTNGKHPLVVPRLARFGEAVDDHQLELAQRLDAAGIATLVRDAAQLPALVRPASSDSAAAAHASAALVGDLRRYVSDAVANGKRA
jgi:UDP-N-acetylglucosamine transferase subunit ALG13